MEHEASVVSRVGILSGRRQQLDASGRIRHAAYLASTTVGRSAWIGENATVMADVGARSIVSAGSVVTRHAPADVVAVGNPARFMTRLGLAGEAHGPLVAGPTAGSED